MDTSKMMQVIDAFGGEEKVTVVTTGAKYIIDSTGENTSIACYQMLNKERRNCTLKLSIKVKYLYIVENNGNECIIAGFPRRENLFRIQINKDSAMEIMSMVEFDMQVTGAFTPNFFTEKEGNVLLADRIGGAGIYPYKRLKNWEIRDSASREWDINYKFDSHCRMYISIFPPRTFNEEQSYTDRIYLMGWSSPDGKYGRNPVPTDEEIEIASKYSNIYTMTDIMWQSMHGTAVYEGMPREEVLRIATCCGYRYVPSNEEKLRKAIDKLHSKGMRVIPYMSPFYSIAKYEDYLDRLKNTIDKYDFDGVYFDGLPLDVTEAYELIKRVRKILGDKLLFVHTTTSPLISIKIHCPFIETYADFTLRAEHVKSFDKDYLRYVISGYNLSNSIGFTCYNDYELEFVEKLLEMSEESKTRFTLSGAHDKEISPVEQFIMNNYYKKLDKMYRDYIKNSK